MDIEVIGNTTVGEGLGTNFKIAFDDNGNFIFTPDENGGSFNIALKRESTDNADIAEDVETFFKNNVTVNGPIMFNPTTGLLTLKDGTEVSFVLNDNDYTLTATAQGDAASKISLTEEGISITPQEGDGTLKLTLGSANGSMSVDIEVLSGGFVFGENGALNVVKDTELQLTFSDDYIVNFKATDAAGGAISIGTDGITFAPNSDEKDGSGVFNGDIGLLEDIDEISRELTVRFDDRVAAFPFDCAEDLEHAYAVTVHKSQGSEFPVIVMPVIGINEYLQYRNLLYTAVTRAKEKLILVGSRQTVYNMVENNKKQKRYSALKSFIIQGDMN